MRYRPDIEGMRALAITLVVAAHAGLPGLQGGFVGVDIFFVISGYLISGLLIEEHARTGRIDFAAFYARRFRRLLPALLLMLLVTAIAISFFVQPSALLHQAHAGEAASIWASNLYFAFEKIEYFGQSAESNAFLHTWSLGVEEQFYLVWPLLLLLLASPAKDKRTAKIGGGMALLLVTSLIACIWVTHTSARVAFYLMPLRAWQFAIGALAYMASTTMYQARRWRHVKWVAESLGIGGVVLIVSALVLIGPNTAYPGGWALLPTIGSALLLFAPSAGGSMVTCLLSRAPMQAIGKISYSWYLWHWPVLVLGAVLIPNPSLWLRLCFVLVAVLIAQLSYRLVERPLRRMVKLVHASRKFILASLLMMLASTLSFARLGGVALARATAQMEAKVGSGGIPAIYPMGCDDWYHSDLLKPCIFGVDSAPKTAVVIGDSIGLQWFPAYAKIFSAPQWRLIVLTKSSCAMVDVSIFNQRIGREFTECAIWRNHALDYIVGLRPQIVIMGSSDTYGFSREQWIDGTTRVLSKIAPFSKNVWIMRSTPLLPFNGPECVWAHASTTTENYGSACTAHVADPRNDEVANWLMRAASDWKNARMLDMNDVVCPGGTCKAVHAGILSYRDQQHLAAEYAESLADQMRRKLGDSLETSR